MASTAQQSSLGGRQTTLKNSAPAPFRASSRSKPTQRQRSVVVRASKEPGANGAQKAAAALAAAAVALTPFAANAAADGIGSLIPKTESAEKNAANDDPIGNLKKATGGGDAGNIVGKVQDALGGAKSAGANVKKGIDTKPITFSSSLRDLQINVAAPDLGGLADKAKGGLDKATGAAKDAGGNASGPLQGAKGDAKSAVGSLKQGLKGIDTKPIAWEGSAAGLQTNVGLPDPFGVGDKNKVDGKAAKAGPGNPLESAKEDAKARAGEVKQGLQTLDKKPVAWNGSAAGLQTNVGLPDPFGLADKNKVDSKAAKSGGGNPLESAKEDAKARAGEVKQGLQTLDKKPVAWNGSAAGLQTSVGLPDPLGLADKNKVDSKAAKTGGGNPLESAKEDAKARAGEVKQGLQTLDKKPVAWNGSAAGLQTNVGLPDPLGLADKNKVDSKAAKSGGSNPLESAKEDAKARAGEVKQGLQTLDKKPVAWNGSAAGLQVNVGLPDPSALADKAKAGADKAAGAAKDAVGDAGGPLQGAKGDAKSALGSAKQGLQGIDKKPVAFSGRTSGLQVNVGSQGAPTDIAKNVQQKVNSKRAAGDEDSAPFPQSQLALGEDKDAIGAASREADQLKSGGANAVKGAVDNVKDASPL